MLIQELKHNEEHARYIAKLAMGTDEELFVKTKASFVEIRTKRGTLQIQNSGTMSLGLWDRKATIEFDVVPNCWQIVAYLISNEYHLASTDTSAVSLIVNEIDSIWIGVTNNLNNVMTKVRCDDYQQDNIREQINMVFESEQKAAKIKRIIAAIRGKKMV